MSGKIIRLARITRAMVRADRETVFVFGDNMERRGFGGQAREMRGEPNTIGVPTKWRPDRDESAYFTDEDWSNGDVFRAIFNAFEHPWRAIDEGRNVVMPADGLGTGLAELPTRAPKIHAFIQAAITVLEARAL